MPSPIVHADRRCVAIAADGERCRHNAMNGFDTCQYHRQESSRWRAAPLRGRWANYIKSEDLAERYQAFFDDPQINDLHSEVAMVDTLLSDIITLYGDDASDMTWLALSKLWSGFMDAVATGDEAAQVKLVGKLNALIVDRLKFNSNRAEIASLIETRRKLVDSENARLKQEQMLIPVERVMFMLQLIISAVKESAYRHADQTTARHIVDGTIDAYNRIVGVASVDAEDSRPALQRQ